jgi:hypothetical protein
MGHIQNKMKRFVMSASSKKYGTKIILSECEGNLIHE